MDKKPLAIALINTTGAKIQLFFNGKRPNFTRCKNKRLDGKIPDYRRSRLHRLDLVEELLKRGEYVRVMDNYSTGRRKNLAPFLKDIDLVEGDLRSYHVVQKASPAGGLYLASGGAALRARSIADPITTHEVNATGTLNLLHAALESHVKRIVYASSSSIYGDAEISPKTETLPPAPKSPYAVSKLGGRKLREGLSRAVRSGDGCLRYFNVFGPRQDPDSAYSCGHTACF